MRFKEYEDNKIVDTEYNVLIDLNLARDMLCRTLNNQDERIKELEKSNLYKEFQEWDNLLLELSEKELELINVKEMYAEREQDILLNFDFKEVYGKNNESIRKNHIKNELSDIVDRKNELELSISYIKRKLDFLKEYVRMKVELQKNGVE